MLEKILTKIKNILGSEGIMFPRHLFIPPNAEPIDIRKLCEVNAGMTTPERFITLKAKEGEEIVITHYGVFTEAEDANETEFFFKANGSRIYRLHGRPDDALNPKRYLINIGVAPDLSNLSLINGHIKIRPTQIYSVDVINRNLTEIPRAMGVRIVGYKNNVDPRKGSSLR